MRYIGGIVIRKKANVKLGNLDKKILKTFGNRVRALRIKKDQSVYDLTGEDMPIKTRQHWQLIENGQKNINLTTVYKVARTLGVDIRQLFSD